MCKRRFYGVALVLAFTLATVAGAQEDDPSLLARWRLDEGSGTIAGDASGNGNDGALYAGAAWTPGVSKTGVYLDGIDDYIEVPVAVTEQGSIGFWFKPDWDGTDPDDYRIFDASMGGIYFFLSKGADETNISKEEIGFYFEDSTDADYQDIEFDPAGVVFADTWFHLAATWEFGGGSAILYFNGEEMARRDNIGPFPNLDPNPHFGFETFAYQPQTHGATGVIDEILMYDRVLAPEEIPLLMVTAPPELASDPRPADEATDVPRDAVLGWTAGEYAAAHDVYFGTSRDDVNAASRTNAMDALVSQNQSGVSYDPVGMLDFETTYCWRVDEVNGAPDNTIFKGEIWSFTTEPVAYPIANVVATSNGISDEISIPQKSVDGSGINADGQASTDSSDMWLADPPTDEALYIQYEFDRVYKLHAMDVWNYNVMFELILGFGLKDVTVEYSEDGADWTALGDVEFAKATAKSTNTVNTTVGFGGVPARYVRLTVNDNWGTMNQYGLSEVRFMFIPAQAREPQPGDGAAEVDPATDLSWRAGREAVSHDVYLGTEPNDLPLVDSIEQAGYTPPDLEFGSTYYWRIDEVNEADATPVWASDIWTFSTQEFALIDGFEIYNDDIDAGTTIFDTWLDGWVNETGSTVGYFEAPFAEKTIVHSGSQSMPLTYDNTTSPFYSQADREFETAQDWARSGADTLVLYIRGNAPDFVEAANGSVVMSGIGTDIWDVADQFRFAYKNLAGDGSMTVRVDSLIRSNEWAKAGVMIRETLEPGSKHAFAAATPESAHGLSFQRRPVAGQASANTDVADIELAHWVRLTRTGNVFTMEQSEDGVTWVDVTATAPVDIQMANNVYIGLAVTSHDSATPTAAEFSNISTTGSVTGNWQTAEVGVAQPTGNSSEPMYVIVEDASGQSATVINSDAAITVRPTWQQWIVPYSDLSGVNLSRVERMSIGVGSPTSPTAGGTGIVYIDDVGFGSPAAQ